MFTLFVVQTVLSAFAATSGLLFNGYILSVLIWQKRIQNANNLFLLNLAIVDILFCLTVLFGNTSLSIFIGSNLSSLPSSSLSSPILVLTSLSTSSSPIISGSSNSEQNSFQSTVEQEQPPPPPWILDGHGNLNQINKPSYTDALISNSELVKQRVDLSQSSRAPSSNEQTDSPFELPNTISADVSPSILPTASEGETISAASSSSISPSSSSWIIVPTPFSLLSLVTNFQGYLWTAFPIIFVWTVAGLTIDKYIAISFPLHYSRLISTRRATLAPLMAWLMGLTLAFPPLLSAGCSYTYSLYRSSATITCDTSSYPWFGLVYIVIYILFSILLPLLAITICNFHILLIAEDHRHRIITAIYEITLRAGGGGGSSNAKSAGVTATSLSPGSPPTVSPLPSSPISPLPTNPPPHNPINTYTLESCPPVPSSQSNPTGSSRKSRSAESLSRRRGKDAFLPVTQLVGSLLLFTTPHYIIFCLESLDKIFIDPYIISLVTLCLTLMPTINAYIYGVKSRLIRTTFKRLLHRYLYKQDVSLEIERRLSLRSQGSQNSLFRSHNGRRNSCPILVQTSPRVRSDFWFTFGSSSNNNTLTTTTTIHNNNNNNYGKLGANWSPTFLVNYGHPSISIQYPSHFNPAHQNYNYYPILRRQSLCIMENASGSNNVNLCNNSTSNDSETLKSGLTYPTHRVFNQQSLFPFNRLLAIDSVVKLSPIEEQTATSDNV